MERFLDTENAALISMHYPQAHREVHFGTAPFNKGEGEGEGEGEEELGDDGLGGGESQGTVETGAGATGTQGEGGSAPPGGEYAGERLFLGWLSECQLEQHESE